MPQVGFFELYPSARPILKAGAYLLAVDHDLKATPPHNDPGELAVDGSDFTLRVVSPRYTMPPDQILATFPPASAVGDWRQRLPQIVFKRRTLPWERDPDTVAPRFSATPTTIPPWLALVVLAEGEAQLSGDVPTSQCVTPGTSMPDVDDTDTSTGKYLEVRQSIVDTIFPTVEDVSLLCHVRKVNLDDTELALHDDDGYLSVVVANRLPQPGPDDADGNPTSLRYTAYLINLEGQLHSLPTHEVSDVTLDFVLNMPELVMSESFIQPPNLPLDVIAMQGIQQHALFDKALPVDRVATQARQGSLGVEQAAKGYATGPTRAGITSAGDALPIAKWIDGANLTVIAEIGGHVMIEPVFRFPVLVSWEFVCTGDGTFESLMNDLHSGMLGTLDPDLDASLRPDITDTGHIALDHVTRRGEPATSWYRGPFVPQPTQRTPVPTEGTSALAHTGDQLRRVVPDGREDVSLASAFEIGRLLALSRPGVVGAMMTWREELFGAARVKALSAELFDTLIVGFGDASIAGKRGLEALIASTMVSSYAPRTATSIGPTAREFPIARIPQVVAKSRPADVLAGFGLEARAVKEATKADGVRGLSGFEPAASDVSTVPLSRNEIGLQLLRGQLDQHLTRLTAESMTRATQKTRGGRVRKDALDQFIVAAERSGDREEES